MPVTSGPYVIVSSFAVSGSRVGDISGQSDGDQTE